MWFHFSIRPSGWKLPPAWDPIAGDYECADGWIRLHTNAPHHRLAAEKVLGAHADKDAVAQAVKLWRTGELESAIVAAGGCAAEMRTTLAWAAHPQGRVVMSEPLVEFVTAQTPLCAGATWAIPWAPSTKRPLEGIRVLDLTRVLAGPVATRFLAGYGAEVLRIDPPGWDEPVLAPEVTLGKRCARLDLRTSTDRATFEQLLAGAHVLLHGYRPGALEALGLGESARLSASPGLIDVSLSAYGWSGPWAGRRGFDSLVQMSAGIAEAGMHWSHADAPFPLPVQALDHATGYLMAAAAIRGITERLRHGCTQTARLSLARTAKLLWDAARWDAEPNAHDFPAGGHESLADAKVSPRGEKHFADQRAQVIAPEAASDLSDSIESTSWGSARRLKPPVVIDGVPMSWALPASSLGSAPARWQDGR
jgi:hypothetical protein